MIAFLLCARDTKNKDSMLVEKEEGAWGDNKAWSSERWESDSTAWTNQHCKANTTFQKWIHYCTPSQADSSLQSRITCRFSYALLPLDLKRNKRQRFYNHLTCNVEEDGLQHLQVNELMVVEVSCGKQASKLSQQQRAPRPLEQGTKCKQVHKDVKHAKETY